MSKGRDGRPIIDRETAESIAAQALAFLAGDRAHFARFLALTGIELDEVRANASSPGLLAAVLAHLAADEPLLLTFAAEAHLAPEAIAPALALLQGHATDQ